MPTTMTGRLRALLLARGSILPLFTALIVAAYTLLCFSLPNLPLHDVPNHAARAYVIADLLFHHGREFGDAFELQLAPQPYLLGDLLFAGSMQLSPTFAARTISWLSFIGLPAATCVYARVLGLSRWSRAAATLAATVAAATITFTLGFLNYQLGLPLLMLALAAATQLLRGPRPALLVAYAACVGAGYLMHLSTPVLLIAAAGAAAGMCWLDRPAGQPFRWWSAAGIVALPLATLLADRLFAAPDASPMVWVSPWEKARSLLGLYWRFDAQFPRGRYLAMLFAVLPSLVLVTRGLRVPLVRHLLGITLAMAALYFALPTHQGAIFGIDQRAAPLIYLFAGLAGIASVDASPLGAWPRLAASFTLVALSALNFVALALPLRQIDGTLGEVRRTLASLPTGAAVLPIRTASPAASQLLHAGEFAVLDRRAFTPYLFSGDQASPQKYFRYRARPYAPSEFWRTRNGPIDWERVRAAWPYLLIIGPQSGVDIPFPVERVSGNGSATLLRVVR